MSSRPIRDAALALSLLTVLPTSARVEPDEPNGVAGWFPAVGLLIGAVGWCVVQAAMLVGWNGRAALVLGAVIVLAWALMTRFLHWDGLADVADGLWGGSTAQRRLEIMKDSSTGAFGATAIALVSLLEVTSVGSLAPGTGVVALLCAPALARLGATFAAWLGTPARPDGLGRTVMCRPGVLATVPAIVVVGLVGALMWLGVGAVGVAWVVAVVFAALVVPHVLSREVGGVTGDIMGASVLICEALALASAALMWGV